jgi:hypothetical protein
MREPSGPPSAGGLSAASPFAQLAKEKIAKVKDKYGT